jgi:hypothetical protein
MQVSGQLHAPATLTPGTYPGAVQQEAGLRLVVLDESKYLSPVGNRTPYHSTVATDSNRTMGEIQSLKLCAFRKRKRWIMYKALIILLLLNEITRPYRHPHFNER